MVGLDQRLPTVSKPSRSDEVLDPAHQLQIADQVRTEFESWAAKRPIKPNRSEPDPDATSQVHQPNNTDSIPELERLHSLKSRSQVVFPRGGEGAVHEEFVETQYYKELVSIDKQHHTTGTGFIRVGKEESENGSWHSELQGLSQNGGERKILGASFKTKSNPATNDWVPSVDDDQVECVSCKPSRSG